MPSRHIALLRGINVGRAKRVAMADLRILIAELGYADVRTLLNSGNAVFTAPRAAAPGAAAQIEKALVARLGVSSRVTVLSAVDLGTAVEENSLVDRADDPARFLIAFLSKPADLVKVESLCERNWAPEALALGTHAAYLWCAGGILKSPLLAAVQRALGDGVTTRNWSTVQKLYALARESGG